jgi:hypothetical protein
MINAGILFSDSARPQAVYKDTLAVRKRGFLISAFYLNRHGGSSGTAPGGFQNAAQKT